MNVIKSATKLSLLIYSLILFLTSFSQVIANEGNQKVRASFLGLAYGDAIGAVTENWPRDKIQNVFPVYNAIPSEAPLKLILNQMGEKQFLRTRLYGYTTDDAQQAGLLSLIALKHPHWDDAASLDWAAALGLGTSLGAWRGTGGMFMSAVQKLASGANYKSSGSPSAGIGAAMRTGVLGAIYRNNLASLRRATIESTLITHSDVRAVAIAYAVSWSVYAFLNGYSVSHVRNQLSLQVRRIEDEVLAMYGSGWDIKIEDPFRISSAITEIFSKSYQNMESISAAVSQNASPVIMRKNAEQLHPNDPFSLLGGIHAIALSLAVESNPHRTVAYIVGLGSDTDTVAAMAGSILGARFGESWIPASEIKEYDRFSLLANQIVSLAPPSTHAVDEFLAVEKSVLNQELKFQAGCKAALTTFQ